MKPSLLTKLSKLIEGNPTYIVEGKLNKNLLAADARKYDKNLLDTLQKDKEIKEHFFTDTRGGLVFRKDVFLQFISNKEFLPDSFTKYRIKIGLGSDDGSLLSEKGDVVLNWPYKDTILEGGQDKEDQKRSEVFFNEVLAPDQITRLLDDKVFTNWKRYDKDGEHDLDELKDDDNLIIKGNNLVVLHSLKKRYAGKIKLIYIDPPYNTGSDSFGYNDRFNHSTWLTFVKNRLEVAKDLLSTDGAIFVQCDDKEQAYLKVLMDDVFSRDNFSNQIVFQTNESFGFKSTAGSIFKQAGYILFYLKNKTAFTLNQDALYYEKSYDEAYKFIFTNQSGGENEWEWDYLTNVVAAKEGYSTAREAKKELGDDKFMALVAQFAIGSAEKVFRTASVSGGALAKRKDTIEKSKALKSQIIRHPGDDMDYQFIGGERILYYSSRLVEINGIKLPGSLLTDIWDDIAIEGIANEGGVKFPKGKKPEFLLKRIIEMSTAPGDLVLDFHVGSGTTAAVAHKLGRRYIGIEQLYYGDNDPVNRLKNVINGDQSGISKSVNWQGGGSFVYANIMNNANTFRERVEKAKDDKEYFTLLEEATSSSFLSYRVDPTKLNETEFRKLSSADKRRLLLELIDNNTLYVDYEDINDPSFKVSDSDKKFNQELYK